MKSNSSLVIVLTVVLATSVASQSSESRNVDVCLSGRYPSLCNHSLLTPDQLQAARAAERRENLRICTSGKYRSLCDHSKLNPLETQAVRAAERVENLRVCSTGKYATLCNHAWLSATELQQVRAAEASENLRVCLDGRYPVLCKRSLLTFEQTASVAAAEAKVQREPATATPPVFPGRSPRQAGPKCESGHWIDSVAGNGSIIKLENGSLWKVDDVDTITSTLWLPISQITVCGTKMINVDDSESVGVTRLGASPAGGSGLESSRRSYVIEAASNDETFVINGEVFKAKTYCFGFERGDRVIFASGSATGTCTSAELVHVRSGKVCRVWCE
jgi:hypothetical protein